MFNFSKRISSYILLVIALLSIPLIAMQFTSEVNWTLFDFLVASFLLITALILIEINVWFIVYQSFKVAPTFAAFQQTPARILACL